MTVEISVVIAIIGCVVATVSFFVGRDKRVAADATWRGSVDAKLDTIVGMRKDFARLETVVQHLNQRVTVLEARSCMPHMEGQRRDHA